MVIIFKECEMYTIADMMEDLILVLQDNLPWVIPPAILMAVITIVLGWFFYALSLITHAFDRRG